MGKSETKKSMFDSLIKAFQLPELRKRILYTLMILGIYMIGGLVPIPGIDRAIFTNLVTTSFGQIGQLMDIVSGGGLYAATIFAMGISPYINSSIIIQLLTVVIPALENLAKEGEAGRKKMSRITRYSAVGLALLQSCLFCWSTRSAMVSSLPTALNALLIIISCTAGTCLVVYLGERINEKGIGNGVSFIIFAGIVTRLPDMVKTLVMKCQDVAGKVNPVAVGLLLALLLFIVVAIISIVIIVFVVFVQNAERRFKYQISKRTVGNKMLGGNQSYIPIKVNQSGVMPVIFSMSILSLPSMIVTMFFRDSTNIVVEWFRNFTGSPAYYISYFVLIIAFTFFYSLIQFNPIEISNMIQKNGGTIPGIRSGKPTTEYIAKTVSRLNWADALFLAIVCLVPTLVGTLTGLQNVWFAGTSVLILTGVANDFVTQVESQLSTRNIRGFLD